MMRAHYGRPSFTSGFNVLSADRDEPRPDNARSRGRASAPRRNDDRQSIGSNPPSAIAGHTTSVITGLRIGDAHRLTSEEREPRADGRLPSRLPAHLRVMSSATALSRTERRPSSQSRASTNPERFNHPSRSALAWLTVAHRAHTDDTECRRRRHLDPHRSACPRRAHEPAIGAPGKGFVVRRARRRGRYDRVAGHQRRGGSGDVRQQCATGDRERHLAGGEMNTGQGFDASSTSSSSNCPNVSCIASAAPPPSASSASFEG